MNHLGDLSKNFLTFEVTPNLAIDVEKMELYLDDKDMEVSDGILDADGNKRKSAVWQEDDEEIWGGAAPKMEIAYDAQNGFLLTVAFEVDKKLNEKSESELRETFIDIL